MLFHLIRVFSVLLHAAYEVVRVAGFRQGPTCLPGRQDVGNPLQRCAGEMSWLGLDLQRLDCAALCVVRVELHLAFLGHAKTAKGGAPFSVNVGLCHASWALCTWQRARTVPTVTCDCSVDLHAAIREPTNKMCS